ncbi:hypothetical protein DM02DRAFT_531085 [Periconia macrospinosa]|uniref:Gfd2/YDR514C-like C-terminal domain-containing protein n=1 Tax=Periconia macrospinosa TaxID=97972 RepID=A0A2V1DK38_9PLEO|nr:hypothetical protein DM02DRAFT_531085 [Periconia macrospinosa]
MASSTYHARLARLSELVQSDLAALPDRTPSPPSPDIDLVSISDDDTQGRVPLSTDASDKHTVTALATSSNTTSTPPLAQPSPSKVEKVIQPEDPSSNDERRFIWLEGVPSTYNLASMPARTVQLPPVTLTKGERAIDKSFAPLVALSKYPYKFCNKDHAQAVASAFFDAGKFWAREWDLYYLWDIEESKPLILVSEGQFQVFLDEINSTLDLSLRITNQQREDGLVTRLPDHPRLQPRYLGRSKSREDYNNLIDNVPDVMSRPTGEPLPPAVDDRSLAEFKQMIEDMWEQTKSKGKAAKEKKKLDRLAKQKVFADQFKRAQRYLGLRQAAQAGSAPGVPAAIDISLPAPYPFDQSVVFICVDVESYEKAHNKITEIGIATLDTRHLFGVPPGKDGKNWRPLIQARHFRIEEYGHLVNSEYVRGCPDRFDFGTSEWIPLRDAPAMVAECFKEPFCGPRNADSNLLLEERNLIFLGHDTLSDVRYLQSLGFDPLAQPTVLETQDTAVLYRVWRRELQPSNLGRILYDFDIPGFNLHNAGNDAVFTVQAMLGTCVREASIRASSELQTIRDEDKAAKAAAAAEEARKQVEDEADGWSVNEADGDGGDPVKSNIQPKQPPTPAFSATLPIHQGGGRGNGRGGSEGRGGGSSRARGNGSNLNASSRAFHTFVGDYQEPSVHTQSPGRSQQNNTRGHANRGRGQGRGQGSGRGRGRSNYPGSSSYSGNGNQGPGQQVCSDLIDLS